MINNGCWYTPSDYEFSTDLSILVDYNIYKSVIRSRKAMKYSEVNEILKGFTVDGYEEYVEQLNLLNKNTPIGGNPENPTRTEQAMTW